MSGLTPEQIAVRICAATRRHDAGEGRHDAERYGPCDTHAEVAPVVAALIAEAVEQARAEVRPWVKGDADTRCQECGWTYQPWFTDNWLWNVVVSEGQSDDDPGGYLCSRCFTDRAEQWFTTSGNGHLVWRLIPEWVPHVTPSTESE